MAGSITVPAAGLPRLWPWPDAGPANHHDADVGDRKILATSEYFRRYASTLAVLARDGFDPLTRHLPSPRDLIIGRSNLALVASH
jgi:hypothetical protein